MGNSSRFNRAQFVAGVAQLANEAVRNAIFELLSFAERNADDIRNGRAERDSFHYAIGIGNRIENLFTCDASGYVSVSFSNFGHLAANKTLRNLRIRLSRIPGIKENVQKYHARPGFLISHTIVDPKIMSRFKRAILSFQKEINEQ